MVWAGPDAVADQHSACRGFLRGYVGQPAVVLAWLITRFEMARLVFAVSCGVLVLVGASVLAGCGDDDDPAAGAPETVTVTEAAPPTTTQGEGSAAGGAAAGPVSRSRAIAIARKRAGGGRVDEVERDDEDGRAVWKVKLSRAGGVERKVSVAVSNGRVLNVEADRDDDTDDGED